MNGTKILLDTNAIISLLKNERNITTILSNYSEVYISVISVLEFQSYTHITKADLELFNLFVSRIIVVDLFHTDFALQHEIIQIRKINKIKLPDAIIAASAMILKADLLTADQGFLKINTLNIISW